MHLFFDTVWKLHIGEIPEKPDPKNYLYPGPLVSDLKQYEKAIAAIKQNALTVGNPEILAIHDDKVGLEYLSMKKDGTFYPWPGSYEEEGRGEEETDGVSVWYKTIVAILTLPEEKKNTMENMTKEQAIEAMKEGKKVRHAYFGMHEWITLHGNKIISEDGFPVSFDWFWEQRTSPGWESTGWSVVEEPTASGSVTAPKEESNDNTELQEAFNRGFEKAMRELVPLREQLESKTFAVDYYYQLAAQVDPLKKLVKEQEEVIKELLPIALSFNMIHVGDYEWNDRKDVIERARKLISK